MSDMDSKNPTVKDGKRGSRTVVQIILLVVLVAAGVGIASGLSGLAPPPAPKDTSVAPPAISLVTAEAGAVTVSVTLNGTVRAVDEADITAQVGGQLVHLSPGLVAGGTVAKDEVVARIDDADFRTARLEALAMQAAAEARLSAAKADLARTGVQRASAVIGESTADAGTSIAESDIAMAQAQVAAAEAEIGRAASEVIRADAAITAARAALATEEALARVAREEWEKYGGGKPPTDLALRKPQVDQATAAVASAIAAKDAAVRYEASAKASLAGAEAALAGARKRLEVAKLGRDSAGKGVEMADRTAEAAAASVAMANADLSAAAAAIARADLNLTRVEIRSPYAGRVVAKHAGLGQQVSPGMVLARVQSAGAMEIELPVPADELPWLDLPLNGSSASGTGRAVRVDARSGPAVRHWTGTLHRTGSGILPGSRVLPVMVRVENTVATDGTPLIAGTFVSCTVPGKTFQNLIRLPRRVMRPGAPPEVEAAQPVPPDAVQTAWILVATAADAPAGADPAASHVRLNLRRVVLERVEGREILVSGGLRPGELVADTAIEVVTENTIARVAK